MGAEFSILSGKDDVEELFPFKDAFNEERTYVCESTGREIVNDLHTSWKDVGFKVKRPKRTIGSKINQISLKRLNVIKEIQDIMVISDDGKVDIKDDITQGRLDELTAKEAEYKQVLADMTTDFINLYCDDVIVDWIGIEDKSKPKTFGKEELKLLFREFEAALEITHDKYLSLYKERLKTQKEKEKEVKNSSTASQDTTSEPTSSGAESSETQGEQSVTQDAMT